MDPIIAIIILLAASGFAIYKWGRKAGDEDSNHLLPPPNFTAIFGDQPPDSVVEQSDFPREALIDTEKLNALLERAKAGDIQVLTEAALTGQSEIYKRVIDTLVISITGCQGELDALVSFIENNWDLRGSKMLAEHVMKDWEETPDKPSTLTMLHMSSLSDDPEVFQRAIDLALRYWREGRLHSLRAEDLRRVVESEYWVLGQEARRSGQGFLLKQKMNDVCRELAAAARSGRTETGGTDIDRP